jgi:hypothetical protein
MRKIFFSLFVVLGGVALYADVIGDADNLISEGRYEDALTLINAEIASNPKSRDFGTLNQKAGETALILGNKGAARVYFEKARDKGVADACLQLGRLEYENYEFNKAAQSYSRYITLKNKSGKSIDANAEAEKERIETARGFLERVENIVVLDSLKVDKDDFISHYKLSASSGRLADAQDIKDNPFGDNNDNSPIFISESGAFMMSAEGDSLLEAHKLLDKSWAIEAFMLSEDLSDVGFPFMMSDGETLYFAACGKGSIGGYDIFVSSKNPSTGEYMSPRNMGMPYNSPANDYMMVIDEETGVGWWATDRDATTTDELTIYIFIPNELRKNYPSDDADIVDKARITNYKSTWGEDDYSAYLQKIDSIRTVEYTEPDFIFDMPDGSIYRYWDDFRTVAGRNAMKRYLEALDTFSESENELNSLRQRYHAGDRSVSQRIKALEVSNEADRSRIAELKNAVIRAEK